MKHASKFAIVLVGAAVFMMLAATAPADWNPGDPCKMLNPQLPDPTGWDLEIYGSNNIKADDWTCSETGPVTDIHFWTSWQGDNIGGVTHPFGNVPGPIDSISVVIAADVPAYTDKPYSHPGQVLWDRTFRLDLGDFTVRPYGTGTEGFSNFFGLWGADDHQLFQQVNITEIENPFIQEVGKIYWLEIWAAWDGIRGTNSAMGWKTSLTHNGDAAMAYGWNGQQNDWIPIDPQYWPIPPIPSEPWPLPPYRMDFAFVITPEPSTIVMLGIGVLGLLTYAWRQRKRTM
jgi:hypothetical protein